ncbi:MAG TPA: hypothetical protein VIV60_15685, partial [Polyangiaceae bacterium]
MASFKTATCPTCGAELPPGRDTGRVTCVYCGATSLLTEASRTRAPGAPVDTGKKWGRILLSVVVSMFVGAAFAAFHRPASPEPRSSASASTVAASTTIATPTPVTSIAATPVAKPPSFEIQSNQKPLILDVNDDGNDDIVVGLSAGHASHFAAFSALDGAELGRTPAR